MNSAFGVVAAWSLRFAWRTPQQSIKCYYKVDCIFWSAARNSDSHTTPQMKSKRNGFFIHLSNSPQQPCHVPFFGSYQRFPYFHFKLWHSLQIKWKTNTNGENSLRTLFVFQSFQICKMENRSVFISYLHENNEKDAIGIWNCANRFGC